MAFDNSILRQIQLGCKELQADGTELLAARVELAQLELRLASARTTRLACVVGASGCISLAGFVILVQLAAEHVPAIGELSYGQTLLVVGSSCLITGGLLAWFAVKRFWRKYRHFEQTIAEFNADLTAAKQWMDRGQQSV